MHIYLLSFKSIYHLVSTYMCPQCHVGVREAVAEQDQGRGQEAAGAHARGGSNLPSR